jgi:hypothetical protein
MIWGGELSWVTIQGRQLYIRIEPRIAYWSFAQITVGPANLRLAKSLHDPSRPLFQSVHRDVHRLPQYQHIYCAYVIELSASATRVNAAPGNRRLFL